MKYTMTILVLLAFGNLQAQIWQDSYPRALELAREGERSLMLVFSGSDWCAPCIHMKRKILDSPEFMAYAAENFVLYNADFPKKKQNQLTEELTSMNRSLAEKYNPKGFFPLIVVLDKKGAVLGETGFYPRYGPKKYIELFNNFIQ